MRTLYYIPITHTSRESVISRDEALLITKAESNEEDVLSQEKEDLEFQAKVLERLVIKQKELKNESHELVFKRDEYIAKRIDETLPEDGIGILFMGANHKVIEKLDSAKIKIVNLLEEGDQG